MSKKSRLAEARVILVDLGLPKAQQNDRTALCLLALLNLTPRKAWGKSESRTIGITPIMDWARDYYGKDYAPNTRETVRRQSMHQLAQAGFASTTRINQGAQSTVLTPSIKSHPNC